MRQLSKIIFIHSANIPYAEVKVDGNVHFTGTQGVGKSTLLRAILFFYNADPSRLGIRLQGQKKFDQFYLPHNNSYIVYEVERDGDRPFCVIVCRQNSRAVYRFADGPFSKDWLIDENGMVTGDPVEVRRRVLKSGTDISNLIISYTDYRDIIYGNRHSKLQHTYERYHLMHSVRYENLPRIITNVFLNERVDADFVKETIIQSLNENEPTLRLKFYSERLKNLAEVFHDTRLWTQKNRKGEIEILSKARRVMEKGNEILAGNTFIRELCGQLNFAFQEAERKIPGLKVEREENYTRLGKLTEKSQALNKNHEKKREKITMDLGVVADRIRHAEEMQRKYKELDIDKKIQLEEGKRNHENEKQHLISRINLLEQKAGDVAARFDRLIDDHKGTHASFKRETEEKIVANQRELNEQLSELRRETDAELDRIDDTFNRKEETANERKDALNNDLHKLELRINETRHIRLYAKELDTLERQHSELEQEEKDLIRTEEALGHRIEAITRGIDNERMRIEADFLPEINAIERECEEVKREIESESELLEKSKGSLIEWLDGNMPGWTETIGKVADEKNVLYNTELSPAVDLSSDNSFFGLKLDLSKLKMSVRTPNEIREQIAQLENTLDKLLKKTAAKIAERDKEIKKGKTRSMSELNEVRKKKDATRGRLMTLPQRIDKIKVEHNALLKKAEEEKENALINLAKDREKLSKDLIEAQDNLSKIKEQRKTERKEAEKRRKGKEDSMRMQIKTLNDQLQKSVEEHRKSTETEIQNLQIRKTDALKKEGVDTDILQSWRAKLAEVDAILAKIEENHTLIVEYRKEKRDFIDRLEEFQVTKESLSSQQAQLDEEYRMKAEKLAEETKECNATILRLKNEIEGLKEDVSDTRRFLASPGCPSFLRDMPELATTDSCRIIIRNMRDLSDRLRAAMEQLKKDTNLFKLQFKQSSPFGFPTVLDSDDDYLRYSSSVRDFVENDKIRDYQTTSNGLYKNILGLISREYSTLVERESEIRKVVNEVNNDFAKKSFAGVIRKIELRLDKSESKVITTLQHIHDFWSENSLEIGEANLFASEESENANLEAVEWLKALSEILEDNKDIDEIRLTDNFSLKMKIDENDNTTGWIDNMRNVGSDGTDILVKAIINILLINVFKKRIGKRSRSFSLHCMMDEIGKLADENIKGIVDFANARDIYIVNSAPKAHSPLSYRHIYMLSKDDKANTVVHPILSIRQKNPDIN